MTYKVFAVEEGVPTDNIIPELPTTTLSSASLYTLFSEGYATKTVLSPLRLIFALELELDSIVSLVNVAEPKVPMPTSQASALVIV